MGRVDYVSGQALKRIFAASAEGMLLAAKKEAPVGVELRMGKVVKLIYKRVSNYMQATFNLRVKVLVLEQYKKCQEGTDELYVLRPPSSMLRMLALHPNVTQRNLLSRYGVRLAGDNCVPFEGHDPLYNDLIWVKRRSGALPISLNYTDMFHEPQTASAHPHAFVPPSLSLTYRKTTTSPLLIPFNGFHILTPTQSLSTLWFISVLKNGYILRPVTHMSWKTYVWKHQ
ncbi:MAG: hypothetical protein Q9213_006431 [Squamulea squamosa]